MATAQQPATLTLHHSTDTQDLLSPQTCSSKQHPTGCSQEKGSSWATKALQHHQGHSRQNLSLAEAVEHVRNLNIPYLGGKPCSCSSKHNQPPSLPPAPPGALIKYLFREGAEPADTKHLQHLGFPWRSPASLLIEPNPV